MEQRQHHATNGNTPIRWPAAFLIHASCWVDHAPTHSTDYGRAWRAGGAASCFAAGLLLLVCWYYATQVTPYTAIPDLSHLPGPSFPSSKGNVPAAIDDATAAPNAHRTGAQTHMYRPPTRLSSHLGNVRTSATVPKCSPLPDSSMPHTAGVPSFRHTQTYMPPSYWLPLRTSLRRISSTPDAIHHSRIRVTASSLALVPTAHPPCPCSYSASCCGSAPAASQEPRAAAATKAAACCRTVSCPSRVTTPADAAARAATAVWTAAAARSPCPGPCSGPCPLPALRHCRAARCQGPGCHQPPRRASPRPRCCSLSPPRWCTAGPAAAAVAGFADGPASGVAPDNAIATAGPHVACTSYLPPSHLAAVALLLLLPWLVLQLPLLPLLLPMGCNAP